MAVAGAVDEIITEVAGEATREVVAAVADIDGSNEGTTTIFVEETSESGAVSKESKEADGSKEDDEPEKETGSESDGQDEETNTSSPPQQC